MIERKRTWSHVGAVGRFWLWWSLACESEICYNTTMDTILNLLREEQLSVLGADEFNYATFYHLVKAQMAITRAILSRDIAKLGIASGDLPETVLEFLKA